MNAVTRRCTSRGIALLTAMDWEPDNPSASLPVLQGYYEDGVSDIELLIGMTNVATLLLVRIQKLTGRTVPEELQYLAENYGER